MLYNVKKESMSILVKEGISKNGKNYRCALVFINNVLVGSTLIRDNDFTKIKLALDEVKQKDKK